jgi:hypothetical protein
LLGLHAHLDSVQGAGGHDIGTMVAFAYAACHPDWILIAGRERIYLDRFWNEFAGDPKKVDEAKCVHYAKLYARPGAMHAAFAQFLAFPQDAKVNARAIARKLPMPVLAIGEAKSFGRTRHW